MLNNTQVTTTELLPSSGATENGIRKIAAEILRMDNRAFEIQRESNLFELGLESLNVIELLTAIEVSFDITIDVEDLSGEIFENFGNLVKFVEKRVAGI